MPKSISLRTLGLERFSGLYMWALFIIVFSVWVPSLFLTKTTLTSIASEQAVVGILALAVLVPMAAGVFDLSVAATINLSTVFVVVLQTQHKVAIVPAILAGLALGLVIGAANGFIIVKLRVNSFIATLGTTSVIAAIQIIVSPTEPYPPTATAWTELATRQFGDIQIVFWYLVILAFIVWWAVGHTPAGRYLYAIGGNAEAARLSGVRVSRYVWVSLLTSGLLAALAGILYGSQNGPSLSYGSGLLLPAFAAVFLGSTQIHPGRVNVFGTLLAIYALATGVRGLQLATSAQWVNSMFNGVALVGAVAFAVWRQGRVTIKVDRSIDGDEAGAPSEHLPDSHLDSGSRSSSGAVDDAAPPSRHL
ncbi:ABC transporter permease [uncultured Jatrophihabitans sp.]|uniref:ABC transporter permease n=1 Tax=uncultured Jatrophihabitans sp. TaxID=1610747 RepID=UPI0035C9DD33